MINITDQYTWNSVLYLYKLKIQTNPGTVWAIKWVCSEDYDSTFLRDVRNNTPG